MTKTRAEGTHTGTRDQAQGGCSDGWMSGASVTRLHEVVFPVLVPVLVAGRRHVLLGEDIVVGVVLLPLLLLALLGDAGFFFSLQAQPVRTADGRGRAGMDFTLASCAAWSFLRSSRRWSSFSCLRSGYFSTFVLLRRLTMGFSRWGTSILLTWGKSE